MRKVSRWLSLVAASAALAAGGCTSTTTGSGSSAATAWHWPWSKPAQPAPAPASTTDPTSLSCKTPKPGPDLYVATARIYAKNGDVNGAADQYHRALQAEPGNLPALLGFAELQDSQRQFGEADKLYQQAMKLHPKEAAVYNDRGLSFENRGKLAEAARMMARAIELQPDKQLYRNNMATILVEMHRNSDALAQLKAGLGPAGAHYNLAIMLHRKGDDAEAQYHFTQAAQIDPSLLAAREWAERLSAAGTAAPQVAVSDRMTPSQPATQNYPPPQPAIVVADANRGQLVQPDYYGSGRAPVEMTAGVAPQPTWSPAQPINVAPQQPSGPGVRYPQYAPVAAAPGANGAVPPSPDNMGNWPSANVALRPLPPVQ